MQVRLLLQPLEEVLSLITDLTLFDLVGFKCDTEEVTSLRGLILGQREVLFVTVPPHLLHLIQTAGWTAGWGS